MQELPVCCQLFQVTVRDIKLNFLILVNHEFISILSTRSTVYVKSKKKKKKKKKNLHILLNQFNLKLISTTPDLYDRILNLI